MKSFINPFLPLAMLLMASSVPAASIGGAAAMTAALKTPATNAKNAKIELDARAGDVKPKCNGLYVDCGTNLATIGRGTNLEGSTVRIKVRAGDIKPKCTGLYADCETNIGVIK